MIGSIKLSIPLLALFAVCAAGLTAQEAAQDASQTNAQPGLYQGVSHPPADDTIITTSIPEPKPPAGQPFNSFHSDWDLMPNSQMTNGSLQTSIAGVDGQVLTVKYKVRGKADEEKKLVVTPKTIIATTIPGTKEDLKPGLKVFVGGAPKLPDGSLDVAAIQVEKEIPPPQ